MKNIKRIIALALVGILGMALFAGCQQQGDGKSIVIAAKSTMTEQHILAEMLKILIEEKTDVKATTKKDILGPLVNDAMKTGDVDLYVEYSRTALMTILKQPDVADDSEVTRIVKEKYASEFNFVWMDELGFNNTYALAMRKAKADEYNVKTYSELAAVSDKVVFGGNSDYNAREDGLPRLVSAYGMKFNKPMDFASMTLKYDALDRGEIDVTNAFTTDARLANSDAVVLQDDKSFFHSYMAAPVIRKEILDKYPELESVIKLLAGKISNSEMSKMNSAVEIDKKVDADVARDFLKEKGLIK